MECKETLLERIYDADPIKVEPYWNVKGQRYDICCTLRLIKVEPYWNVKFQACVIYSSNVQIKVEPYWNVKEGTETIDFKISVLK